MLIVAVQEFANPPVDRPDHGWLVVNCTMSGLCAAHLTNGQLFAMRGSAYATHR